MKKDKKIIDLNFLTASSIFTFEIVENIEYINQPKFIVKANFFAKKSRTESTVKILI